MQEKYSFKGVGSSTTITPNRQAITVTPLISKTSTADSGRNQLGVMDNKVLFSVQAYKVKFPTLYKNDFPPLLQMLINYDRIEFHYFNPVLGIWKTEEFYVENIQTDGVKVKDGEEKLYGLEFQITAINPL